MYESPTTTFSLNRYRLHELNITSKLLTSLLVHTQKNTNIWPRWSAGRQSLPPLKWKFLFLQESPWYPYFALVSACQHRYLSSTGPIMSSVASVSAFRSPSAYISLALEANSGRQKSFWWQTAKVTHGCIDVHSWAPSQYKDRLIYVWWFPC